jgi:hypothetical protein
MNYTKNRVFSVESAYHLKAHLYLLRAGRASSSVTCEDRHGWLTLWVAEVPNKVKVHAWRLEKKRVGCRAGTAETEDQAARVRCVVCDSGESLLHRYWKCPHAISTWELVRYLTQAKEFVLHR